MHYESTVFVAALACITFLDFTAALVQNTQHIQTEHNTMDTQCNRQVMLS